MPRLPQPPESPKSDGGHASTLSTRRTGLRAAGAIWAWITRLVSGIAGGFVACIRAPIWRKLWRILWKTVVALVVLAMVGMVLVRFVLWPRVSVAREWMEREASSALHANVGIGSLETYWEGWHPAFRAQRIEARDTAGRQTFAVQDVQARLSWRSLLRMQITFAALHASRADVLVRRTPEGALLVAGMPLGPDTGGDSNFFDQLLSQGDIDFREGAVRWLDEQQKLPEVALGNVHVQLRSGPTRHRLDASGTSPSLFNGAIKLRADFRHDLLARPGDWRHWHGQANWQVDTLQLAAVQRYVPVMAAAKSGTISSDGSVEFADGVFTRSQARLTGQQLDLQIRKDLDPLQLRSLQALATQQRTAHGEHTLRIDTLLWQPLNLPAQPAPAPELAGPGIEAPSNPAGMPRGLRNASVGWALDTRNELRSLQVKATTLDLTDLRSIATAIPLPAGVLEPLRTKQPAGRIDDLDINWQRDVSRWRPNTPAPVHFTGRATLRQVSFGPGALPAVPAGHHPEPAVPGVENLSGNAVFSDDKGTLRIDSSDTALLLPGLFDEARVPLDRLQGTFNWTYRKQELIVSSDNLTLSNGDLSARFAGNYRHAPDTSHVGTIDLKGTLERATVTRVPRYLPLSVGPHTREYLAGALQGGTASDVTLVLTGDLYDFPYRPPHKGVFRVEVPVKDVTYQPAPADASHPTGWPAFTDTEGTVVFDGPSMSFKVARAKAGDVTLTDVSGSLPDMGDHHPLLTIDGRADGATQSFLQYIEASPVGGWIGHFTKDARAQGNAALALKLDLPLNEMHTARAQGSVTFLRNEVTLIPQAPPLTDVTGALTFTHKGIGFDNLRARFAGGEIRPTGGTAPDGTIRIQVAGTASAQGLRETTPEGSPIAAIARTLDGSAPYNATISVKQHRPVIQVQSDLTPMTVRLPAPLNKAAGQPLPVRFDMQPLAANNALDEVTLQIGNIASARYELRSNGNGTEVLRGGIGVRQPVPQPAEGVQANLTLDRLDIDAWRQVFATPAGEKSAAQVATEHAAASAANSHNAYLPTRLNGRAQTLRILGRDFSGVSIDATRDGANWQSTIDSREIAGTTRWHAESAAVPFGELTMRLSRMSIPDAKEESALTESLASSSQEIPSLDLVADKFDLRGKTLGKLEIKARSQITDGTPVWTLETLKIEQPGATLTAQGTWRIPRRLRGGGDDPERRTLLDFHLDLRDSGELLQKMGFAKVLDGAKGRLEGRVVWRGSPMSIDTPTLNGRMALNLERGQFLPVDPGLAKLAGVLSLQGLLHFATDLRSATGRGTPFESVAATGTIASGVARTEDFTVKGPQFQVAMQGSANILEETQDLRVKVTPKVDATSASLAAAFINPAIGLGTLAAQLILGDQMSKAFATQYHVTGSWADPKIEKVASSSNSGSQPQTSAK
ncbi:TIGR02099 family protein [Ralstonia insidiosa]|nr:TIGR02099 family protein [Ralstonia insidiosa]MBA9940057.1 TIGR02099 family protein [Ralstonia insidiosa]